VAEDEMMELKDLRNRFEVYWRNLGARWVSSFPLLHDDPSVLFVNAGVTPFKSAMLAGEDLPVTALIQRCFRARWESSGSYRFEMMTLVGPGGQFLNTAIGFLDFLRTDLRMQVQHIHCVLDRNDKYLENLVIGEFPSDRIHHHSGNTDEVWTRWEFGCGKRLTGCGLTLYWVQNLSDHNDIVPEQEWLPLGNFVYLSTDTPGQNYFDIGFGLERVACALGESTGSTPSNVGPAACLVAPFQRENSANIIRNMSPQEQAELWSAIFLLVEEGVEASPRGAGHVLRRMLRSVFEALPYTESYEVLNLINKLLTHLDPPLAKVVQYRVCSIGQSEHERYLLLLRRGYNAARKYLKKRLKENSESGSLKNKRRLIREQLRSTFGLPSSEADRLLDEIWGSIDEYSESGIHIPE
jgi:alanyl-tRNA synthetase